MSNGALGEEVSYYLDRVHNPRAVAVEKKLVDGMILAAWFRVISATPIDHKEFAGLVNDLPKFDAAGGFIKFPYCYRVGS